MKELFFLRKDLIKIFNEALQTTCGDVREDYAKISGGVSYNNGLSRCVWDNRFNRIEREINKLDIGCIRMNRSIWKAPLVLDDDNKVLYIFASSENFENVMKKIKEGNKTHYMYILALNSEEGDVEQLELIEEDYAERKKKAEKLIGDDPDRINRVVIVHYSYFGDRAIDGTLSLLDNCGNEKFAIKIEDYLIENTNDLQETTLSSQGKERNERSSLVIWNKDKQERTKDSNNEEKGKG